DQHGPRLAFGHKAPGQKADGRGAGGGNPRSQRGVRGGSHPAPGSMLFILVHASLAAPRQMTSPIGNQACTKFAPVHFVAPRLNNRWRSSISAQTDRRMPP